MRALHLRLRQQASDLVIDLELADGNWFEAAARAPLAMAALEQMLRSITDRAATVAVGRELGSLLHDMLLSHPSVQIAWLERSNAALDGAPARLAISVSQMGLLKIPWEGMYDRETGRWVTTRAGLLYCLQGSGSLRRAVDGQLKVLVIHATPDDGARPRDSQIPPFEALNVMSELGTLSRLFSEVQDALQPSVGTAEMRELERHLRECRPDVLHFLGHSYVDDTFGPVLVFVDSACKAVRVTPSQLGQCFRRAGHRPELVVLPSCWSASVAGPQPLVPERSFATGLLDEGVPIVVACRYQIADNMAAKFDETLYAALIQGSAVDDAVAQGRAVLCGESEHPADWMAPMVLTTLGPQHPLKLWSPDGGVATAPAPAPERQAVVQVPPPPAVDSEPARPRTAVRPVERSSGRVRLLPLVAAIALVLVGVAALVPALVCALSTWLVPPGMVRINGAASYSYGCPSSSTYEDATRKINERVLGLWRERLKLHRAQGQEVSAEDEEQVLAVMSNNIWVSANEYANGPSGSERVPAFNMDRCEVSNREWAQYLRARPRGQVPHTWDGPTCPPGREDEPVGGVDLRAAEAYARWRGVRLPTTVQWQYAASGGRGLLFPWGNEPDAALANVNDSWPADQEAGPRPVTWGSPHAFGLLNMSGNVSELTVSSTGEPVLCGGDYTETMVHAVVFRRTVVTADNWWAEVGLRCVSDVPGPRQWALALFLLAVGLGCLIVGIGALLPPLRALVFR